MTNKSKKPILFLEPVFKQMIWGGNRLREKYGYHIPSENTGECWGIAAHPTGDCVIADGVYQGRTLSHLWKEQPELFGNPEEKEFPLLIKILDAREDLSIQVHPDDAYARENENGASGKTECSYILDCPENAELIVGHNARTKEELQEMVSKGEWNRLIRRVPIKKGDFIQVEPGTVHAITKGLLLLEIQQNSDVTYRIYDYDRLQNGKPRQLHIKQGLDVIQVPATPVEQCIKNVNHLPKDKMNLLLSNQCFSVWKLDLTSSFEVEQNYPFLTVSVMEGEGSIDGQPIKKGDNFILPSGYGNAIFEGQISLMMTSAR